MTKKRLSWELGEEYLRTSDCFEDSVTEGAPEDKKSRDPEYAKALRKMLEDNLTKKQKWYIILYYRDGLTVKEIAEKAGVDKSTVSRTINRGRRRIANGISREAMRRLLSGG